MSKGKVRPGERESDQFPLGETITFFACLKAAGKLLLLPVAVGTYVGANLVVRPITEMIDAGNVHVYKSLNMTVSENNFFRKLNNLVKEKPGEFGIFAFEPATNLVRNILHTERTAFNEVDPNGDLAKNIQERMAFLTANANPGISLLLDLGPTPSKSPVPGTKSILGTAAHGILL